jgi:hypothetical protein
MGVIRRHCIAPLAVAVAAAAGGCFYSGDINAAPRAEIERHTAAPIYRGDPVTLGAAKSSDPDHATSELRAAWRAHACNADRSVCHPEPFAEMAGRSVFDPFSFSMPACIDPSELVDGQCPPAEVVHVTLEVADPLGRRDHDTLIVDAVNRPPTLSLRSQGYARPGGGFTVETPIEIYATAGDPDPGDGAPELAWAYYPPSRTPSAGAGWAPIPGGYVLVPDVEGLWTVEVTAVDQLGAETVVTEMVLVRPDGPPCIALTAPAAEPSTRYVLDRADGPRAFSVLSVLDDLDHYPPFDPTDEVYGEATFRWALASPDTGGALVEVTGHAGSSLVLEPDAYAPGDVIALRVEVADRVERVLGCDPAQATCSLTGDQCYQRVTWEAEIR